MFIGKQFASIVLALASVPASAFGIDNFARVSVTPNAAGGTGPVDVIHSGLGVQDTSASGSGGDGSTGSGTTHADYGHIKLHGNSLITLNTISTGYIQDNITITSPTIPAGTLGSITYSVTIGGTLAAASGSSGGGYILRTSIGGAGVNINRQATFFSPEFSTPGFVGDPFGTYTATATNSFQYGFPAVLHLEYTGSAGAANSFTSTGSAAYDLNFGWGGISSITAGGSPVNNATVSSDSGANWLSAAVAVPEPSGVLLLIAVLPLLARRKRVA